MSEDKKNKGFLADLARRGVFQAVGIYVAVAWGSIEILITASERFGWPTWLADAALILFLTGLPFIVLLSWAFDLTGSGLKRMEAGSLKGKALIAGSFTVVLGLSAAWFFTREPGATMPIQGPVDERPIVAVMPFSVVDEVKGGTVLALAFTDELINRINAHPDLVALDLNTVTNPLMAGMLQGGSGPSLRLDYLVTGSLRAARNGIELRTRMTDPSGRVAWDNQTVLDQQDAHGLRDAQARVAAQVASELGSSLTGLDYCEPSANPEAVELYYDALERYQQRGANNVASAAKMLERALELDPQYARAMALLTNVYERFNWHVMPEPEAYDMTESELVAFLETNPGLERAQMALALCPNLASAYFTVQTSVPAPQTFADAVEIIEEALRREPGNLDLRSRMVDILGGMGHFVAAGQVVEEMFQRDPLNPRNTHMLAGIARVQGQASQALELERRALEMGYVRRNAESAIAFDLMVLADLAGLDALLGEEFQPGPLMPVDPRAVYAAQSDAAQKADLVARLNVLIDEADTSGMRYMVGNTLSLMLELRDPEQVRRAMKKRERLGGPGSIPWVIWHVRYRDLWDDPVSDFPSYAPEWQDFWARKGPPDGCRFDDLELTCD